MVKFTLNLNSFLRAGKMNSIVKKYPGQFDLLQDHYVVNAKSQLGVFSLDLNRPIDLRIESPVSKEELEEALKELIIR